MLRWHRPARLVAGGGAIACAVVVYLALGERPQPQPPPPVERLDPKAVAESIHGIMQGLDDGFELRFATMATYEDGSTRMTGVTITTPDRHGRHFVVTAGEARETSGRRERRVWELSGGVQSHASDGFELATDRASLTEADGIVQAAGDVTFGKGRMSGAGRGMVYDLNTDVLRVAADTQMQFAGDGGGTRMTAGSSVLDRMHDTLVLERDVHVLDREQEIRADRAFARLAPGGGHVTFVELRGRAQMNGAEGVESMRARDIDLDYTDDGAALERATLDGGAVVRLDGTDAREIGGEHLDVTFAADRSIGQVTGHTGIRMLLPAAAGAPAREIESAVFEVHGEGGSLTHARFERDVVFREENDEGMPRVARAQTLAVEQDAEGRLTRAVFSGDATFEDGAFAARAAEADYDPARGALLLSGIDARGEPRVEDERVIVDANRIALALETRGIDADGNVKTTLLPSDPERSRSPRSGGKASRTPGLLDGSQTARVTAATLDYEGSAGAARYGGGVRLWQKETDLRADTIDIDFESGDLVARGSARAVIALDTGRSQGEADEIQYADAARRLTYTAAPGGAGGPAAPARLTGPEGDLRAAAIAVFLAEEGSRVTSLEAEGAVDALVDDRRITGTHLQYHAGEERYVVRGSGAAPVRVHLTDPCRELVGGTLIYSRAADTMQMDGSDQSRTEAIRSCR